MSLTMRHRCVWTRRNASTFWLCVALLAAPWALAQTYPPALVELVARAKAQVRTLDMAGLKSALDSGGAGLLIDVREPHEFQSGHIPGAINIPRGQIELAIWPRAGFPDRLDLGKRLTLYCGSGIRCILAAKSLQDLGFTNVVAVDMRLEDWVRAGYPLAAN